MERSYLPKNGCSGDFVTKCTNNMVPPETFRSLIPTPPNMLSSGCLTSSHFAFRQKKGVALTKHISFKLTLMLGLKNVATSG